MTNTLARDTRNAVLLAEIMRHLLATARELDRIATGTDAAFALANIQSAADKAEEILIDFQGRISAHAVEQAQPAIPRPQGKPTGPE